MSLHTKHSRVQGPLTHAYKDWTWGTFHLDLVWFIREQANSPVSQRQVWLLNDSVSSRLPLPHSWPVYSTSIAYHPPVNKDSFSVEFSFLSQGALLSCKTGCGLEIFWSSIEWTMTVVKYQKLGLVVLMWLYLSRCFQLLEKNESIKHVH